MPRLIGIGSALVDALAFVPEDFLKTIPGEKGGMRLVERAEMEDILRRLPGRPARVPGGSAANTAVGAAHLGLTSRLLTKTGDDDAGRFYRQAVAGVGVGTLAFKTHPTEATGTCLCLVTPDSQRTMRTYLGAAATLDPAEIDAADFVGCTHAHVEGYLLFNERLMRHVLNAAKTAGCAVSLDLASPEVVNATRALLPDLIRDHVDMVFANEDEAAAFAGTRDEDEALRRLARLCRLAVVKVGARGSLIRRGDETVAVPARRVQAVDTTGAGDLWAAGFLGGLLAGRSLAEAGRLGSAVAAAVVQETGAVIPESSWAALRQEFNITRKDG